MTNKPNKPLKVVPPKTPTKDEEMMKRIAYFAQRREQMAVTILASIVRGNAFAYPKDQDKVSFLGVADLAVEMADRLLEKLYPKPKEEDKQ